MSIGVPIPLDRIERVVEHWAGEAPRYDPQRCTTGRHDGSSCRACEAACPAGALRVDAATRLVGIEAVSCTGCDACVAACPTAALRSRRGVPASRVVACPRASGAGASPVGCAGGVGTGVLLALAAGGGVEIRTGDCDTCPSREAGERAREHVVVTNRILAALDVAHRVTITTAPAPAEEHSTASEPRAEMSRRGFFKSLGLGTRTSAVVAFAPEPGRDVLGWADPGRDARSSVAGSALAALAVDGAVVDTSGLPAGTPTVTAACDGCGVCAAFCPTAALQLRSHGEEVTLEVDVSACVACGLCETICPTAAMAVEREVRADDLRSGRRPVWKGRARTASRPRGPLTTAAAFTATLPARPRVSSGGDLS